MDNQFQQTPLSKSGKVRVNPFTHFFRGNKNLFSTNAPAAILASLISAALGFGIGLLFILLLASSFKSLTPSFGGSSLTSIFVSLIVKILAFWLISSLITGYFAELVSRTVLTGTRREHVSFGSLFPFVAKRYLLAVLSALMVGGVFVLGLGIIIGAGLIQPALALLAMVIVGLFLVIFAFRMSYVFFVVVDDEQPQSARWVLKRSSALWKKSGGALIIYYLLIIAISIVFSILSKSHSTTTTYNNLQSVPSFNSHPAIAYGSLIVYSLFEGILGLIISATVGDIYNQAKQAVDGNNQAPQVTNQAPAAPVNPYLTTTTTPTPPFYPSSNTVTPAPTNPLNYGTPYTSPEQPAQVQPSPAPQPYQQPTPQVAQPNPNPGVVTPQQPENNYPQPPQQPPTPFVG